MSAAAIVLLVIVLVTILVVAAYLRLLASSLMRVASNLSEVNSAISEIPQKTEPLGSILDSMNRDLGEAKTQLDGVVAKRRR